jgi:transposase
VTKAERELVKEQLKVMMRKLFGASSEKKRDPRQGDLFLIGLTQTSSERSDF